MINHLNIISLLPLPLEAQRVIAASSDSNLRLSLVTSNYVDQSFLNTMINDSNRDIQHTALSKIIDQKFINNNYTEVANCCKKAILKNKNLNSKILSELLEYSDTEIKLLSFIHVNTDIRLKKKVPMDIVAKLVTRSNPLGETVVRSLECIYSNPWLLKKAGEFSHSLKRAALSYPYLTEENMAKVKSRSLSKYLKSHPLCRVGYDITKSDDNLSYYIDFLSPAFDFHLVNNKNLTLEMGKRMLVRDNFHTEPNIIARLLERFGVEVIPDSRVYSLATTRTDSSMFISPLARYYNDVIIYKSEYNFEDLKNVINKLGTKKENWTNFINLHRDWSGNILDLAEVAVKI